MKDLWAICMDIYRQMYKEATPSVDFDTLRTVGETAKPKWFMKYYLDQTRQDVITEQHCKKHRLNPAQRAKVRSSIWLGCSPRGTKEYSR